MPKYNEYDSPTRPDPNCRSCTDFKTWSRKQREITQTSSKNTLLSIPKNGLQLPKKPESVTSNQDHSYQDCPLDKDSLGQHSWGLLHTIAAVYPTNPTEVQKKDIKVFFDALSRLYPCDFCAKDFQRDLKEHPVKANSHAVFTQWLCEFHNRVNRKLGKPSFDCSKADERWRDGWRDGSCD